jgi:hypothetical protein
LLLWFAANHLHTITRSGWWYTVLYSVWPAISITSLTLDQSYLITFGREPTFLLVTCNYLYNITWAVSLDYFMLTILIWSLFKELKAVSNKLKLASIRSWNVQEIVSIMYHLFSGSWNRTHGVEDTARFFDEKKLKWSKISWHIVPITVQITASNVYYHCQVRWTNKEEEDGIFCLMKEGDTGEISVN